MYSYYSQCLSPVQAIIPIDTLRDFIAYARLKCQPELTEEAGQDLVSSYLDMRQQGISRNTITATPRQLESMVRLSEALARMRLSASVERHDVAEATRLMKASSHTYCCVCWSYETAGHAHAKRMA